MDFETYLLLAEIYKRYKQKKGAISRLSGDIEQNKEMLERLAQKKLIELTQRSVKLTEKGLKEGFVALRKQGVITLFLKEVLALSQKESNFYLKDLFAATDEYLLEKLCTLLGHPTRSVQAGPCCQRAKEDTSEEIIPLSRLPINTPATIVYIQTTTDTATMQKLFSLKLYPGKMLRIHQLYPVYIVHSEDNEIAFEKTVAEHIFVKK